MELSLGARKPLLLNWRSRSRFSSLLPPICQILGSTFRVGKSTQIMLLLLPSRGMMFQNSMYYLNTSLMYLFITKISDPPQFHHHTLAAQPLRLSWLANVSYQGLDQRILFSNHVKYYGGFHRGSLQYPLFRQRQFPYTEGLRESAGASPFEQTLSRARNSVPRVPSQDP